VIANRGADLLVRDHTDTYYTAVPQKKLGLVVCGDKVHCERPDQPDDSENAEKTSAESPHKIAVRVSKVEPRSSVLARTDRRRQPKAIAANVTQLVVVTAPKPPFDPLLIDRYTIAAHHMNVSLLLVINKADLISDAGADDQADAIETLYSNIGYPVIRCSCETGEGLDALAQALAQQTAILVGQSGVGKSSLLSKLLPEASIRTGALSEISGLGRHTTTVTTWYDLANGGTIIDSAGVRQFSLEHLSGVDIQAGFVEIQKLSHDCRFRDCTHQHEPDCAVLEALEHGKLSAERYRHFISIRSEEN
jgi:ribosome biogenesis GTPase